MVDRDRERRTGSEITPVRVDVEVRQVTAEHVTFTQTYTSPGWERPEVSWSTLRFLAEAGWRSRPSTAAGTAGP
ncbi:hypothetical protein ACFWYW_09065 [Nonomuraea sp. NPDC059023]|uniref:hypothetical protein n=1 Tax=unclassified Nonomuraea TaxID=2593643 RepID=UPI0036C874FC